MGKHTGDVYDGECLDWGFVWSAALQTGDTVTTSTWDVGDDLTVTRNTLSDGTAVVMVTGFVGGESYTLTNHIVCDSSKEYDQTITLRCIDTGMDGGVVVVEGEWADGEGLVWADGEEWVWIQRE